MTIQKEVSDLYNFPGLQLDVSASMFAALNQVFALCDEVAHI